MRTHLAFGFFFTAFAQAEPPVRRVGRLGRGAVAVPAAEKKDSVSWRLPGTDADRVWWSFNGE